MDLLLASVQGLVFQFDGKFYEQVHGIAMGVACCPDVANLFVARMEKTIIPDMKSVFFYGRYFDDCLLIIEAQSLAAAELLARSLAFPGFELTWSFSETAIDFLDMTVFFDTRNSLEHVPFRKKNNSMQRIPWASHHPLDVKRGTFIGEMSRLATLCSRSEYYTI